MNQTVAIDYSYSLILVRVALCRRCLTAVGHYFAYFWVQRVVARGIPLGILLQREQLLATLCVGSSSWPLAGLRVIGHKTPFPVFHDTPLHTIYWWGLHTDRHSHRVHHPPGLSEGPGGCGHQGQDPVHGESDELG